MIVKETKRDLQSGWHLDYKKQGEQGNENIVKRTRISIILSNVTSHMRDVSQNEFSTCWTLVIHFANTRLNLPSYQSILAFSYL